MAASEYPPASPSPKSAAFVNTTAGAGWRGRTRDRVARAVGNVPTNGKLGLRATQQEALVKLAARLPGSPIVRRPAHCAARRRRHPVGVARVS